MIRGLYSSFKEALLDGTTLRNETLMCCLADSKYVPDFKKDKTISNLPRKTIVSERVLKKVSIKGGKVLAADVTFALVPKNREIGGLLFYLKRKSKSKSLLVAYTDHIRSEFPVPLLGLVTGFPFITTGSDIIISWDKRSGIFQL